LFVWGRHHIGASQEKRKEASPILSTVCWKTHPPKITKMLSIKNSSMLMIWQLNNKVHNKSITESFLPKVRWVHMTKLINGNKNEIVII
jgi:hypothetical protein